MNRVGFKICGIALLILFMPGSPLSDEGSMVLVEKQIIQMENQLKALSSELARLKGQNSGQAVTSRNSQDNASSQVEVVKTYIELMPDPQVHDQFFRTIYLAAKVRVQNVGTNPSRDIVVYATCPDCERLGWQPKGDLDKLSGTIKFLAPSDKEEISLTLASQSVGVAQRYDDLRLPKDVMVRIHEGGCREMTCPIEVVSNKSALFVAPEGAVAASIGEPFYRISR